MLPHLAWLQRYPQRPLSSGLLPTFFSFYFLSFLVLVFSLRSSSLVVILFGGDGGGSSKDCSAS